MEEADLLKERLQAITDKRKIREDIAKKRREIEEEKLKLQYIKKKALREQWLMDGLSQQTEEELEAMKQQALDEQQQSDQLQSNILRIEKEISDLENEELQLSANEEVILKRLKEVERTNEDIIKRVSVEREADGKEVNKACSETENLNFSVTMETAEQSGMAMDCEVDLTGVELPEAERDFVPNNEEVCLEADLSEVSGEKTEPRALLTELPEEAAETGNLPSASPECPEVPLPDHNHASVSEPAQELNRNESVNSSVSDTPSSADSVYEIEAHRKTQETPVQEPQLEQGAKPEPAPRSEQNTHLGLEPESEQTPNTELDPEPDLQLDQFPEPEQDFEPCPEPDETLDPELEQYPEPQPDPDLDLDEFPSPDMDEFPEPGPDVENDFDGFPALEQEAIESVQAIDPDDFPDPDAGYIDPNLDDGYCNLDLEDPGINPDPEGSALEQCIRDEAMSDMSSESGLNPDEMDECLQVEIAAASSDSDADEKWRTIFSSSINKEDDDSYLDSLQLSAQELFVQKVEVIDYDEADSNYCHEVQLEVPNVKEVPQQDGISAVSPPQEVNCTPLGRQGLSKISEDDSENGKDVNHNDTVHRQQSQHSNADSDKKIPKDFCVIQETKSENVSTEHVDFQLARKQWRDMEEQTKNKVYVPTTKQPSFHGSHSFMYTPVRNIERTQKRTRDLESLNLVGDYSHTQFSPCSEDSGLDDSSYRSPCDDLETPVEREIRISMEREETFRRERAFTRMGKSTDCAPSRGMPRSISTPLTPSFVITSSPTREPVRHEMTANNVIILDPCNDATAGPRQVPDISAPLSDDGTSNLIILETSNLIIRSASEFSLNKVCEQPQEKMFLNNPFFKLRSRSTISLVDEEIKMVKQREEELRKERASLYAKDRFRAERMSLNIDTLSFGNSDDVPMKCKSSPSSPMKTGARMDRSTLSCDHRQGLSLK
ncbi:uncharacterized protein palmdb isoform X2 [Synchiropus splendidus]|uniref:uncharacterized protein palmdb isoform X2 n=1 Tax=Synchiropus splendidus TaxID=270530 RepID=UPI00237D5DA7|nr:uncharacterized protein palmdb isoform X2 [Synchiropus splendidus]